MKEQQLKKYSKHTYFTLSKAEIICDKNMKAWVSMIFTTKGGFLSERADPFIISSNRQT